MPDQEKRFISRIHNYCDRWCERCAFTTRCRVFTTEQEDTDDERDINNEAFWRKLVVAFAQAKQMLAEKAVEFEIDLNTVGDEKFAEHKKREKEKINREDLTKLAGQYSEKTKTVLKNKDEWLIFSALDEDARLEMLGIIYWYQYFISAKIQRGLRGILDFDGSTDKEELNDSQSDTNGSIKIALIAAERSVMAWTALMTTENSPHIKPLLFLLETIHKKAEEKFSLARDFIRPGFDEVETVM